VRRGPPHRRLSVEVRERKQGRAAWLGRVAESRGKTGEAAWRRWQAGRSFLQCVLSSAIPAEGAESECVRGQGRPGDCSFRARSMNRSTPDLVVRSMLELWRTTQMPYKTSEQLQTKLLGRTRDYSMAILALAVSLVMLASGCAARRPLGRSQEILSLPVAPIFVAREASGGTLRLTDARGRWLALFFFCGCQPCKETAFHLADLARRLRGGTVWAVTELSPADVRSFARATGMCFPVALDPGASVKQAFAVEHCPTVVLVNQEGKVESRWSTGAARQHGQITTSALWRTLEARGDR
jgi:peroxiredoxin